MGALSGFLLFLIFLIIGIAASALIANRGREQARARAMHMIAARAAAQGAVANNAQNQNERVLTQKNISAKLKKAAREQKAMLDTTSLASLILQAGFSFPLWAFWVGSVCFGTVVTFTFYKLGYSLLVVILMGFTSFFGIPKFILKFKAKRRQRAFLDDFADALEGMNRLMKSGMPVAETINMLGREFTGPMGEEMERVYHQQKLGTPMADAIRKMVPRMPLPEVQMFATAIAIQQQTGSSLSEVLMNLSGVIRARYRLKRKVQALSAEAKISAMIIAALPVVVATGLYLVKPDYIGILFEHTSGQILAGGAVAWMMCGVLVMRQMINFKV